MRDEADLPHYVHLLYSMCYKVYKVQTESGCTGQKLKMMLLGERKRGRPQRSFMDVVKEDVQL